MKLQTEEISKLNAERAGHQARIHEIDTMLAKHESAIAQDDASKLAELYKDNTSTKKSVLDMYTKGNQ